MIEEKIDEKLLQQAIQAIRHLNEKFYGDSSKKRKLFEDEKESAVYLQVSLKKIPKCKLIKMIKINLPHSLVKDDSEICLITGDLDKRNKKAEIEPDRLHFKDLLKKHGVDNVSEIVTLRQLRTEYKPFEAKQKLLAAYDIFLADRKIAECLPRVLGRHFFKKRKFPIQITLNTPNLKQQVEKAIATKVFYLTGHGNSCNSEVATLDMSDEEISENVVAMVKALMDKLPGSFDNIMGIYLKTALSKAIPIYMSYDDPNKIHIQEEADDNTYEIDELSTCPGRLVKVYKDGNVRTIRMKRMAETESSESSDISDSDERKKKKKKKVDDNLDTLKSADLNGKRKKKKKNIDDKLDILESTDLNAETTEIGISGKRKKKTNIDDNLDTSESADLNAETTEIGDSYKKKKKKKNMDDNLDTLESIDLNAETTEVGVSDKKKKKKKNIDNDLDTLKSTNLNVETTEVGVSDKRKKKKKNIDNYLDTLKSTDLNAETIEVGVSDKRKKKKKNIDDNLDTLESTDLNAETSEVGVSDKKKKKKKNIDNNFDTLKSTDLNAESAKVTEKKKKEKHIQNDMMETTDLNEDSSESRKNFKIEQKSEKIKSKKFKIKQKNEKISVDQKTIKSISITKKKEKQKQRNH